MLGRIREGVEGRLFLFASIYCSLQHAWLPFPTLQTLPSDHMIYVKTTWLSLQQFVEAELSSLLVG